MLTNLFILSFVTYCSIFIWWIKRQLSSTSPSTSKAHFFKILSLLIIGLIALQWLAVHHFITNLTLLLGIENLPLLLTITLSYTMVQLVWRIHLSFSNKSLSLITKNRDNSSALQLIMSAFCLIQFCLAALMQPLLLEYGILISLVIISAIYALVWFQLIRGYQLIITIFLLGIFNIFALIKINVLSILVGEFLVILLFLPMSKRRKFLR